MKKKIVILTNTLMIGGAEKQIVELVSQLKFDYQVFVFLLIPSSVAGFYAEKLKQDIVLIESKSGFIKNLFFYTKTLREIKPDIVLSFLFRPNLINALFTRPSNIVKIGSIRSSIIREPKLCISRTLHNRFLDGTIVNSKSGLTFLTVNGFDKDKLKYIGNFIEISSPSAIRVTSKECVTILSVGRFDLVKDYLTAIKSVAQVTKKFDEKKIEYLIIGYGPLEEEIRDFIEESKISNIKILIDPPNLSRYYQISDIYLQTSLYEGTSNSILEAMNASLPVVATNVGDNGFLIENKKTGFLVSSGNVKEVTEYLSELIKSETMRVKMGHAGRQRLCEFFDRRKTLNTWLDYMNNLSREKNLG